METAVTSGRGILTCVKVLVSVNLLFTYIAVLGGRSEVTVGSRSVHEGWRREDFIGLDQCCSCNSKIVNDLTFGSLRTLSVVSLPFARLYCSIFSWFLNMCVFK